MIQFSDRALKYASFEANKGSHPRKRSLCTIQVQIILLCSFSCWLGWWRAIRLHQFYQRLGSREHGASTPRCFRAALIDSSRQAHAKFLAFRSCKCPLAPWIRELSHSELGRRVVCSCRLLLVDLCPMNSWNRTLAHNFEVWPSLDLVANQPVSHQYLVLWFRAHVYFFRWIG